MTDQPADELTELTQEEAAAALTAAAWTETPGLRDAAPRLLAAVRDMQNLCRDTDGSWLPTARVDAVLKQALGDEPLPEPRTGIHCLADGFGADWDLEAALALLPDAERIAWISSPLHHDLAVFGADGRILRFEVARPGALR